MHSQRVKAEPGKRPAKQCFCPPGQERPHGSCSTALCPRAHAAAACAAQHKNDNATSACLHSSSPHTHSSLRRNRCPQKGLGSCSQMHSFPAVVPTECNRLNRTDDTRATAPAAAPPGGATNQLSSEAIRIAFMLCFPDMPYAPCHVACAANAAAATTVAAARHSGPAPGATKPNQAVCRPSGGSSVLPTGDSSAHAFQGACCLIPLPPLIAAS